MNPEPPRPEEVRLSGVGTPEGLVGDLTLPDGVQGVVLFAHGSGSSRHSSRNRWVARQLNEVDVGTLLMDLLTTDEERLDAVTARLRFDVELLTSRVLGAVDWLVGDARTRDLPLGLFGASTGAAAALAAAAARPDAVRAVVSRGGRPDLAAPWLSKVRAPTLLIVGGRDEQVLELNERAAQGMDVEQEIRVVEGATHLFEEPGALDEVASASAGWFRRFLRT